MFNFTSNRRSNNNKSVPRSLPPQTLPNHSSITRSVLEGVGMGAGSAIGRSIVEQGFDSISRSISPPDDAKINKNSLKNEPCNIHIDAYYKCIHNLDGTYEYNNCKTMYDNYLECVTKN